MKTDVLFVILTENYWLFRGLELLLPEITCQQMPFGARSVPHYLRDATRVVIVVDSSIFFSGEWSAYNLLKEGRSDASMVWLSQEVTGRVFPEGSYGALVLKQKQSSISLRRALHWMLSGKACRDEVYAHAVGLTSSEYLTLPWLLSGISMQQLSRLIDIPEKTLYGQRRRILVKTGFRLWPFLQFVCGRNPDCRLAIMSRGVK
ncbi:transcriptional regulator [Enterobacter roggenkampii]|uniref:transcriptional regulator n=1 Tax=Enterobacter roggenkampii TaxID=1812935 RepID=UPI003BD0EF7E